MNPKVSIIIPVYNAERYLLPCIESLLKQTLIECEFIFVNDGSRDSSRQIIEQFIAKEPRMKLINQANQGVSMARNVGIAKATGEYIGFVDADDTVEADMFEKLYRGAIVDRCDTVISNFESELGGHKVITTYPFTPNVRLELDFIQQKVLPQFLETDYLNSVCNKLYRSCIVKEYHIVFPEKVALGEDGQFNIHFFSEAKSMKYMDYTGYHYREVTGSATRNLLEHDYFGRALEAFRMELPPIYTQIMQSDKIRELKSIRLLTSTISYIYTYFKPNSGVSFWERYKYVKQMITNSTLREALPIFYKERYSSLGRYEKLIVTLIKAKLTAGLLGATTYIRFRNR
ncbi:glycosyltransferase [Paenibacillus harenae]|uniref:Glycosyltransferase involved in cell wall biosynthesis n=2 Tax=Paenibacillus harenae TaxID=306543 RepID=A0ABT9U5H5_PAEHA|nr:glycosyltransferase involved in cell wall biosynthesis [Paenibacillus harenae]